MLVLGRLKQLANIILLMVMLGAVYTHYALKDKFERMAPGLVFSLLLLTRLIIYRQVSQREKYSSSVKVTKKYKQSTKGDNEEHIEQDSDDQQSQSDSEDKPEAFGDKKNVKKNK